MAININETPPAALRQVRLTLYKDDATGELWMDRGSDGWNRVVSGKQLETFNVPQSVTTIQGASVGIMGDSMTNANRGVNEPNASQIWWGLLKTKYNWITDVDGISGTSIAPSNFTDFTTNHFSSDSRIQGFKNRNFNPDMILVFGGTNDFGRQASTLNIQLGTINDSPSNTFGSSSFYSALKYMYNSLKRSYPNAKIVHIEPLQRADKGNPATQDGKLLPDFITAINTVAKIYGVTVLHTFTESGLTYANMTAGGTYSGDGLHPNVAGHAVFSNYIGDKLEQLYSGIPLYPVAETTTPTTPVTQLGTLIYKGEHVIDFPSVSGQSSNTQNIAVPGAIAGDVVHVSRPTGLDAQCFIYAFCNGADNVSVRMHNFKASVALDLASATYQIIVIRY